MSGSRRSPVAGSTSGSCSVARGGWRSPATAPGPSPTRSSPRSRRPTRTRRAGASLPPTDELAGAWPLGHRVTRRAGRRWLLVGDAAGFLDPFTGEGIHRALVSAELAAAAICAHGRGRTGAFAAYERAMQRRFLAKDGVSWLVQAFLGAAVAVRVRGPAGRRPADGSCDDGSRDGRPRPRRSRARSALPRRPARAVTGA